jgi:nitrogen fixation/metabolism regulation signal transduction histidine kinase
MGGIKHMNRILFATCILSFAFASAGIAQDTASSTATEAHYTQAQLKQLTHTAHTQEQYAALVIYYGERQNNYLQKAAEEKQEWVRRSQNITSIAAKYPRPVDSARNLYDYYMYKASEAGSIEVKYNRLASADTQ